MEKEIDSFFFEFCINVLSILNFADRKTRQEKRGYQKCIFLCVFLDNFSPSSIRRSIILYHGVNGILDGILAHVAFMREENAPA